jgi:hypothetical protein
MEFNNSSDYLQTILRWKTIHIQTVTIGQLCPDLIAFIKFCKSKGKNISISHPYDYNDEFTALSDKEIEKLYYSKEFRPIKKAALFG